MEFAGIKSIVILTGAGVSAESGLATFRGPNGLWEGHRVEDVATPEAFARDPALVHAFYDARRAKLGAVETECSARALARLDAEWPGELLLVTQNVDDLHERAGSKRLIHMHGELTSGWCLVCDARFAWKGAMGEGARARAADCGAGPAGHRLVRRDAVRDGAHRRGTAACDLFVSIGTSGAVYPAAGFVQTARYCGAKTLEINLEPSLGSYLFDESRTGPAGKLVPQWVDELLIAG